MAIYCLENIVYASSYIQCHSRLPVCLVNAEQIRQHLIKTTFARATTNSHAQALQVH